MKIIFIGAGFVGATTAAAMADSGHEVLVFDINEDRTKNLGSNNKEKIESCLFEEGLANMLINNKDHITFSHDYDDVKKQLDTVDAIFICVATPQRGDGSSNMEYYNVALEQLSGAMKQRNSNEQSKYIVLVNKSTVPIETANYAKEALENAGVKNFGVASNPEFLVEGKAVQGNTHPTRIVVGATDEKDFAVMRKIYNRFFESTTPYIEVSPKEAAAGKLISNFLLFDRLMSTYGVIGRLTETFDGVDFENLRKVVRSDGRFGEWGFYDSLFAGGSCLEKDVKSLAFQMNEKNQPTKLLEDLIKENHFQLENFLQRIEKDSGVVLENAKVAIFGMAFKQDTNDVRNSAGPSILKWLAEKGVKQARVFDPKAKLEDQDKPDKLDVVEVDTEEEALKDTDLAIIVTDWQRFRMLAPILKQHAEKPYCIADGRRMLHNDYTDLQEQGFTIIAVGSPLLKAK